MFNTVQVNGTVAACVKVDPRQVLQEMLKKLTGDRPKHEVTVKNDELYSMVDTSYHGSPQYEYTKIGGKVDARMYVLLNELLQLMDAEEKALDELSGR